ncbi:MAG: periplasmic protein TonB [Chthoniobacteraceae bacterium]|nr:periplasmic protein TonB [Chthoniobacteraceae bacterium]
MNTVESATPHGGSSKPNPAGSPREYRGAVYLLAFAGAALLHGALLLLSSPRRFEGPESAINAGDQSVEMTLVAALPAEKAAAEEPLEPEPPEPPSPEPPSEPPPPEEPPPIPAPPEAMVKPMLPPRAVVAPKPLTAKPVVQKRPMPPRSAAPPAAAGDGSSAKRGSDATSAQPASGDNAKPGYLRNPHPAYPEAARRAKQEGVVKLRVRLNADGSVGSVSLGSGSGFPLLDERALSVVRAEWRFKPARIGGSPVASEFIVPIRFSLRN